MTLRSLFVLLTCSVFSACWFSNRTIPMPLDETGLPKPTLKPLKFSAARKIQWNVVPADSIHPGHIYPFDISKMASRLFNPSGIRALQKPAFIRPFQYNALADTILNLESIPAEPVVYKTSLLGKLKKTTLAQPRLRAESYHTFFQYGDEQGLPGQEVDAILHTRDGLCWIATMGGISILNGESLETLPFNYGIIFSMAEDSLGQVWICTQRNGVFIIDRKAGIQKQLTIFKNTIHVRVDKQGYVWIASYRYGVYLINPGQKTYKNLTKKYGLSLEFSFLTMEDRDGRIWILNSGSTIDILDPKEKKIKRLGKELGGTHNNQFVITENKKGDILISGEKRGIDIINIRNGTHKYLDSIPGLMHSLVFSMLEDEAGNIWIAKDSSGISILTPGSDSVTNIGVNEGLTEGFNVSLDKDDQHQVFVGTVNGGMFVFPAANRMVHHISKKDGLTDNNDWGFLEDQKHRLWIGTYDGLNIITADQQLFTVQIKSPELGDRADGIIQTGPEKFVLAGPASGLTLIDESAHTLEKIGMKEGMPTNNLRYSYLDSRGMIWITSTDAGLILFDPNKRSIRYLNEASGLSSNRVTGVTEISPGNYLITNLGGVDYLNLAENTISTYSAKDGLSNDQAIGIFKDSNKRYWIISEKGLNLLDTAKQTNTIFSISNGMPANGIYSLMEKEGRFYAGTGKGLTILYEKEKTISGLKEPYWDLQTYGRSIGMPTLDFNGHASVFTHTGQFWWGTVPGIITMGGSVLMADSIQKPVQVVSLDLLGKPQYFIDPALIQHVDTVWSDIKDTFYLKGSFSEFNVDKQRGIEWKDLSPINVPLGLSLPYDRNYLRFHFGNFLPQYQGDYRYQYILDGVDEKWNTITDLPYSENYNNISPGYYSFRVSVKNGNGPWSQPSEYHFRIRPPWWQSWWAELIYLFAAIGIIWLWVRYRSRRLLRENAMLEQKITERTAALSTSLENLRQTQGQLIQAEKMASLGELTAGIAHEIQNPLNFVNNFSEVNTELIEEVNKALEDSDIPEAKEILKDVEMNMGKITFHGKRADTIVKGMLLHSRASSQQKIPTNVNELADEYLRLSYHGLRARDKSFNAQFSMDLDNKMEEAMLVQQDIGRVFLNLFNNAFYSVTEKKKMTPDNYEPFVSVSTKKKMDSIEIRIWDNGQGIPKKVLEKIYQPFFTTKPAGQGTGLGLSLSYDIVTKEHGGKIDVVTKENEFTEFIIELPIKA